VRARIGFAARLLGELIAAGRIRTFVTPYGGGSPVPMAPGDWELDDFRTRFASCAVNVAAPFAGDAEPTHWIFVDLEDFNRIVEQSCANVFPTPPQKHSVSTSSAQESPAHPPPLSGDRHVRMPELQRRTGMSRSTIHRRIAAGRFPEKMPMDGNISVWWESEIAGWLASPR
jgi:prophage regulatory protein